ncbi:MAG: HAF repeat-containing protein, partial [Anaerolineae bacterium]|nr:HAF repeat-containing protein [Anaerolineae bacterium]NIN94145.1 HAF repeat-containing protein [Anaerolineae bacterium]
MNDLGQVVGNSHTVTGDQHAFLWTLESGIADLGTLGGRNSVAYGINNLGQVVGESDVVSEGSHAFLWSEDEGMTDLGTLGGSR